MLVVKIGGGSGLDIDLVCNDVAELIRSGEEIVLIHGGSHETDVISEKLSYPPRYVTSVSGVVSRYTDRKTLEIFLMVTAGRINKLLVERLQQMGVNAVGLSGLDGGFLVGKRKGVLRIVEGGKRKVLRGDYGGVIEEVRTDLLSSLLKAGYTPVVAPVAISREKEALNVDGDRVAAAIGAALGAKMLVILSNIPGLLRHFPDENTLIRRIPKWQAEEHLNRYAHGRMKKKLLGTIEALKGGVGQVVIADGRVERPIQRALAGEGTVVA